MTPNHPSKWQRNGRSTAFVLTAVIALLLVGCAQPATPLASIDAAGRAPATVDADKLACWQEAEEAQPLTASLLRMRAGLGSLAYAVGRNEERARNERIERAAEACMAQRGYTVRPRRRP
jgi:hypothetical protein